jgi:O-antigen/teichoic acid export membrane protein
MFGAAAMCGLIGVNLLVLAVVFALIPTLPAWAAAAIVAAGVLVIGGICAAVGWSRRVKDPMDRTRDTLKENLRWAKQRTG